MLVNKKPIKKVVDSTKIMFKSNVVTITLEDGIYGFDIHNKLYTNDVLEAVSILTHLSTNDEFWNYEINDKMLYFINPTNSIYWLSGGNEFWENWNYNWSDNIELYTKKFSKNILNFGDVNTLNDIKLYIQKNYNLDVFYEFALKNNII